MKLKDLQKQFVGKEVKLKELQCEIYEYFEDEIQDFCDYDPDNWEESFVWGEHTRFPIIAEYEIVELEKGKEHETIVKVKSIENF